VWWRVCRHSARAAFCARGRGRTYSVHTQKKKCPRGRFTCRTRVRPTAWRDVKRPPEHSAPEAHACRRSTHNGTAHPPPKRSFGSAWTGTNLARVSALGRVGAALLHTLAAGTAGDVRMTACRAWPRKRTVKNVRMCIFLDFASSSIHERPMGCTCR